ncbi:AAA domain-containing protein [Mycoplasma sp. P36-A1]|uniref:AAA domain-containing protein n=1 Tax=Mycoplasma sp. P36-A1 TaxID=3252900 RepID=UPI003C2EC048
MSKQEELKNIFENYQQQLIEASIAKDSLDKEFKVKIEDEKLLLLFNNLKELANTRVYNPSYSMLDKDLINVISNLEKLLDINKELNETNEHILSVEKHINEKFEDEFLNKADVEKTIKILKYEYKSFIKRLFSSDYKNIFRSNKLLTKDLQLSYDILVKNLEDLANRNDNKSKYAKLTNDKELLIKSITTTLEIDGYDFEKVEELYQTILWLNNLKNIVYVNNQYIVYNEILENIVNNEMIDWDNIESLVNNKITTSNNVVVTSEIIKNNFDNLDSYDDEQLLYFIKSLDFNTWVEYKDYVQSKRHLLNNYNLNDFIDKIESDCFLKEDILNIFKKRFYFLFLEREAKYDFLRNKSHSFLNQDIVSFKENDKNTFKLSKEKIRLNLLKALPNVNENNCGGEMQILKKELLKKSRQMSTRKLIASLPTLLPRLKPCMMMSPLSVSAYFSTNTDWSMFDLVIFDEASQVKTESAIAAIARGKQIVIAGDSKQMPPSAFFNSNNDDDQLDDIVDLESILDELSAKIPNSYLNWHYRSKDESLISFSNHKFYEKRLTTFPSNNINNNSNVTFNYVKNGIWESKLGNVNEAKEVALKVYDHIINHPHKSLGIVAFGISQANLIEDEVISLRDNYPEIETFFDENKDEAFFIKNLENVQGDERDVIILSVGYGRDLNGNIKMNFGPLTSVGGERRLNVAITRAKEYMHIFSSIRSIDIKTDTNNNNRLIFRDFLDYTEKGLQTLIGYENVNVENNKSFDSNLEENIYNYLIENNFDVHTKVGASDYKIDLAIVNPKNKDNYIVAIECDGQSYHSSKTARDRDRLRQEILETKGWSYYRIYSTCWINDNNNEKAKLLEFINQTINNYSEEKDKYINNQDNKYEESNIITLTKKIDTSLPTYHGKDVYLFEKNIKDLAQILLIAAKTRIGYDIEGLIRAVNLEVFDKKRLTAGYKKVYEKAMNYLISREYIIVINTTIHDVKDLNIE